MLYDRVSHNVSPISDSRKISEDQINEYHNMSKKLGREKIHKNPKAVTGLHHIQRTLVKASTPATLNLNVL